MQDTLQHSESIFCPLFHCLSGLRLLRLSFIFCLRLLGSFGFGLCFWGLGALPAQADTPYNDAMQAIAEGRLTDAELLLTSLINNEPRHAGAWLDLAMLYCASGNKPGAERLFLEIEQQFAPPPAILEVIARQRQAGCTGWQAKNDYTVRFTWGRETNANQGASNPVYSFGSGLSQVDLMLLPDYLPKPDGFKATYFELARELTPKGLTSVVQFQTRNYDNLSQFNSHSLFVGAELPFFWRDWVFKNSAAAGWMTLSEQLYLRQQQLQFEVRPPLGLPPEWQASLATGFKKFGYPTLPGFDANWREFKGILGYSQPHYAIQINMSSVQDIQAGQRPGGDRRGNLKGLSLRRAWNSELASEFGLQSQSWSGERLYSPGLIDVLRQQHTKTKRLSLNWSYAHNQALILEYKNVKNDENISIFGYRNKQWLLHWQWLPFAKHS
jgi:hypothetical protein